MLDSYEINSATIAIIPVAKSISRVVEEDQVHMVNKSTTEIVDDSCRYFGSSYLGRHEGTKNLIGVNYKSPIIIEETRELIFFPTSSPRFEQCHWIALKKIDKYEKSSHHTKLSFKNGYELVLDISYGSLENQILRSTLLESVIRSRKVS